MPDSPMPEVFGYNAEATDGKQITVIEQVAPTTAMRTYSYQELADDDYIPITIFGN